MATRRSGSGTLVTAAVAALALSAPAGAPAQEARPIEVPLRIVEGRLVVPVVAGGGHELAFLLSPGSGGTVLTESVAAHLEGRELRLGSTLVSTEGAHTVADGELSRGGTRIDGVVGGNTLSRFDLLVDAPHGRILLGPVGARVSWPGMELSEPIRLRVYHGIVIGLDVTLEGQRFNGSLDLGTPSVLVNEPARVRAGLEREDTAALGLGSVTMPDMPVALSDLDVFDLWDPDGAGFVIVGAAIVRDCAVSISWVHAELRTCRR